MKTDFNLEDKVFIVVGALGRLGKVIVSEILALGANVIAVDLRKKPPGTNNFKYGSKFRYLSGDITSSKFLDEVIDYGIKNYGAINGGINTAYPRNKNFGNHFLDVTYEDFCENISLHLGGYFLFMQKCTKYSLESDQKFSLINFSSIYGVIPPKFDIYKGTKMTVAVEYAAIKSAIQHLSVYTTAYTKGSKFRVNCISPGGMLDNQDEQFLENYSHYSRSKGMLHPNDILGAVFFLCSDLSEYVCGQNIVVDDGFSS